MDDAVAIIVFGFSTAAAQAIISTGIDGSIGILIFRSLREIVLALFIGFLVGLFLSYFSRKAKGEEELL
ncbi:MAG TPA: hypothetical protein DEB05_03365, partial [Firmicutes bacterium]|nr:hypothetical protein [Bacillota bacterium]